MIKVAFKLVVSFCELMIGVIGLLATVLYFYAKMYRDGGKLTKNYSSKSSRNITSDRQGTSQSKRLSINTNSFVNRKPIEVETGMAVKMNPVVSCSKNAKSVNSSDKNLFSASLSGPRQPKVIKFDQINSKVMLEDSDNSSSDIYHEHHLEVESLQSKVKSEKDPVNESIKNFVNKSSEIADKKYLEVQSLQNKSKSKNDLVNNNTKNCVNNSSETKDVQHLKVKETKSEVKLENYSEHGCILNSGKFTVNDNSTSVVKRMSQENVSFCGNKGSALEKSGETRSGNFEKNYPKNSSASDRGCHNRLDKPNSEDNFNSYCEHTDGQDLGIDVFEKEEKYFGELLTLFPNLKKNPVKMKSRKRINNLLDEAFEYENIHTNNELVVTSKFDEKLRNFCTLTVKIRKEALKLVVESLDLNENLRKKRVIEIESDSVKCHRFLKDITGVVDGVKEYQPHNLDQLKISGDLSSTNIWNDKVSEMNEKVEVLSLNLMKEVKLNELKDLVGQVKILCKEMVNSLQLSL